MDNKVRVKAFNLRYDDLLKKQEIVENNLIEGRKINKYLERAKDDFLLATATKNLIEKVKIRLELGLPEDYQNLYHWLIIHSYYSMYHAATACIAKKKVKARSHIATITSLAKHYLTEEELELDFIDTIEYVYITYIESGRESRRGAQYNVDKEYTKEESYEVFENAKKFVKKIQELLE